MLTLTQTRNELERTMRIFGRVMQRDGEKLARSVFKNITRRVLALTPPSHAATITGDMALRKDAYWAGANRIARQMQNVLAPVRLKHKRKERHPDVAALYRGLLRNSGGRLKLKTAYVGQKFYVDAVKFRAVLKDRQARIGRLASGWTPAARAVGVAVPEWVARHGTARGTFQSTPPGGGRIGLRAVNLGTGLSPEVRTELARRIPYALQYERSSMVRQIHHLARTNASALGIRARSAAPALAA
jgi:hypothetical protein